MARKKEVKEIAVYCIRNLKNEKRYIGSSYRLKKRKSSHFSMLKNITSPCKFMQEDYNKFGKENFIFEVLEYCKKEELIEREQYWMDFYKSYEREFGYNTSITAGRVTHTEEMKKELSVRNIGNKYSVGNDHWLGRVHKEESKLRMSISNKGKNLGKEHSWKTKKKISESTKGENNPMFGKQHSEKTKQKLKEVWRKRKEEVFKALIE